MPSQSSFDLIWRSLEDEMEDRADQGLEISDHALWMEFFRGDRRYEIRVSTGPGISCLVQVDQTAVDAAVDTEGIAGQDDYRGGSWLSVEFCVNGPASEPVDHWLLQRVVEEFWPDVDIHHESIMEARHDDGDRFPLRPETAEQIRHHHFRFTWLVGFEFVDRISEFVDALIETMRRLSATVPPGRMI